MAEAGEGDLDYTENEEVVCQRGKLKAIIEELKEDKRWRQWRIKRWKQEVVECEKQLEDVSLCQWKHQELEESLYKMRWNIRSYEEVLSSNHNKMDDSIAQLKKLDSEEYEQQLKISMEEGCLELKYTSGVLLGLMGSGLENSLRMALSQILNDADLSEHKYTSITQANVGIRGDKLNWMQDNVYFSTMVNTAATSLPSQLRQPFSLCCDTDMRKLEQKSSQSAGAAGPNDHEKLNDFSWIKFIFCDVKTPQFLGVMHFFLQDISLGIFCIKLDERLDHHPVVKYYDEKGKDVQFSCPSSYTHEQIIKFCMRAFVSLDGGRNGLKLLFVGTHLDLIDNCDETLEDKTLVLHKIVRSFKMTENVIVTTNNDAEDDIIFPINAKTPGDKDWEVMRCVRRAIIENSHVPPTRVPIKWFCIELLLWRGVKQANQEVLLDSTLFEMVSHFQFDSANFKSALKYLHRSKLIYYLAESGLIVANMQVIPNKINELVHYQLSHIEASKANKLKNLVLHGIISIKCLSLKEFKNHYVEGVFSAKELLQIFVEMCVAFDKGHDEFLMQCLLPMEEDTELQAESKDVVPPMVIEFPEYGPVMGTYTALICYLIDVKGWNLEKTDTKDICHLTRSSVHFAPPMNFSGTVIITDPLSNYLIVRYTGQPVDASQICPLIRQTILDGVTKVSKTIVSTLNPDAVVSIRPKITFQCPCGNMPFHPAIALEAEGEFALSCPQMVTTDHKTWFEGPTNDLRPDSPAPVAESNVPPLKTLKPLTILKWKDEQGRIHSFHLIDMVSSNWRRFGILLNLTTNNLDAMWKANDHHSAQCWNRVMQHWLNGGGGGKEYAATWDGLYDLLKDAKYAAVAEKLQRAVTSWVGKK